jgi:hypothetical protein
LSYGMKLVLGREPDASVLAVLVKGHEVYRVDFEADGAAATALISVGKSQPDENLDEVILAAHTAVASVILNLDETVTKE